MAEWEGWSIDQRQVDRSRVVRAMVDREGAGCAVPMPAEVAAELGLSMEAETTDRLILDLLAGDAGYERANGDGGWNTRGRTVAGLFRGAANRRERARGARRAVLLWLDDHHADHKPPLDGMLREPHSWFWGTQFTIEELDAAAGNLADRGFATALGASGRRAVRLELSTDGDRCVDKFAGDPDEMERQMTNNQPSINIGSYTQSGGNNAIASHNFTQNATTTIGQTAAEVQALLAALREAGDIPADLQKESEAAEADLRATDTDESAVVAVRRAGGILNRIATSPIGKPVTAAAIPLIANLIGHWAGMPPAS